MLNDVKKILGIYSDSLDPIIQAYILGAKMDLQMAGILTEQINESDPLIYSAIVSYVLSNIDTYEYRELSADSYSKQKDQLRHYGKYNGIL